MKRTVVLFKEKKLCCGCTACMSSCPVDAIEMKGDEEGFEYPVINLNKCIGCEKCKRACPMGVNIQFRREK